MAAAAWMAISILAAWLIGSLPLGSALVRWAAGAEPAEVNPHLIGVENVYRLVGAPVALSAFLLDVLKGALAVAALPVAPLAALGVTLGHLYPLPLPRLARPPRARGHGVLLGALAGLVLSGALPWLALALPIWVYAAVLGVRRYMALAAVSALAALATCGVVAWLLGPVSVTTAAVILALAGAGSWRQKAALARVQDGTEPRLGEPPAVRGLDKDTVLCAFMVHPMTVDDLWQPPSQRWLRHLAARGLLSEAWLRRVLLHMRPQSQGVITGVRLPDGRQLRVLLIAAPLLPDQFGEHPDTALRMAIQGARLAYELGAEAVGLGAFWSTVGDKGAAVQRAVPEIAVTNGGAYTAGSVRAAVPGLLARFAREGGALDRATAAVVGANGVVAFGVARMIAPEVGELVLVGRDMGRLRRSAQTLRRKFPATRIIATTDLGAVAGADLVFTATSDPAAVIYPQHVRPGAWIFDLGRPADVHPSVREVPGVQLVPGGVVRPPGEMRSEIDMRFGEGFVPACLAETMIMTAAHAFDRRSLGTGTRTADIEFYLREGEALGFEIVTRDDNVAALEAAR
ncbi:MAG: glycerol-3-phosphate acyltransferase [Deinococcales bacterium]